MSYEDFSSSQSSVSAFIQDPISNPNPNPSNSSKRHRGTPDPDAEVVALSPRSLTAKNRFVCEICNKGFQRDQNLQLHRRGHNLPWKLKQRNKLEAVKKKVYICPEVTCVHHDPARALGDLTGVKKHYFRKHGEKKWKCEKCSKKYAVQSDWKAHSKVCGTREYKCGCGTLFSRRDSFITHRAFCDALTEENSRMTSYPMMPSATNLNFRQDLMTMNGGGGGGGFLGMFGNSPKPMLPIWLDPNGNDSHFENPTNPSFLGYSSNSSKNNNNEWLNYTTTTPPPPPYMSATALLHKASQIGSTRSIDPVNGFGLMSSNDLSNIDSLNHENDERLMMLMMNSKDSHDSDFTRDFLGVGGSGRRTFNLQQNMEQFNSSMQD